MKKKIYMSLPINLFLFIILLSSCSGDDDGISGTGFDISGGAEKGPFVKNSDVSIARLTSSGESAETLTTSTTIDDLGNFEIKNISTDGPVIITINGKYFNEISGQVSDNPLSLNAIYLINSEQDQNAKVNALTSVISTRIRKLMLEGSSTSTAIQQSQDELTAALKTVLVEDDLPDFTALSVYNIIKENEAGNAYLLAFSAIINQLATDTSAINGTSLEDELSQILTTLANDIADNGLVDDTILLEDLKAARNKLVPSEIEDNLKTYSFEKTGEELDVPTLAAVLVAITSILLSEPDAKSEYIKYFDDSK